MSVLRTVLVLTCALAAVGVALPTPAEEQVRKGLPRLGDASATEEVTGRIADSTRGKPGPVRLVLNVAGATELAALVAPNKTCDALGLSLKTGEDVTIVGRMMTTGERPLLVTEAVVVDGRRIDVRAPNGGWMEPQESAPKPSPQSEPEPES